MLSEIGREARLVALARLFWGLGDGMVVLILPIYLTGLGAQASNVGSVFGVGVAVGALLVLPAGALADRIGRKPVMILSAGAALVGLLIFLVMPSWEAAYVAAAIYWSSVAALPPMNAHLAANQTPPTLGRAMGFSYGVSMVGTVVGPAAASAVAFVVGLRAPLVLAATAYLALAGTVLLLRSNDDRPRSNAPLQVGVIPAMYWALMLVVFFAVAVFYLPILLLPVYLRSSASIPLQTVGVYIAVTSVGGALISGLAGYSSDRVGPGISLIATATVLALGVIGTAVGNAVLLPIGLFLLGAQMGANPIFASLVSRTLPLQHMSTGFAVLQLVTRLGTAAAGVLAGVLYERGPQLPLIVSAALAVPVAASVAVLAPGISHRLRTQPGSSKTPGETATLLVSVAPADQDRAASPPRTAQ